MTATHGDLFREIGALVVAAHAGDTIDLTETSEQLAARYVELGVPAETIARAIARSVGAVGISLAIVQPSHAPAQTGTSGANRGRDEAGIADSPSADPPGEDGRSASGLFPSGLRIAVLS